MEKWKNGRVEDWKNGRSEEWKNSTIRQFDDLTLNKLSGGKMEEFGNSTIRQCRGNSLAPAFRPGMGWARVKSRASALFGYPVILNFQKSKNPEPSLLPDKFFRCLEEWLSPESG